jgi:hypothetical protein
MLPLPKKGARRDAERSFLQNHENIMRWMMGMM